MSRVVVTPITVNVGDCLAHLLEVTQQDWIDGRRHYIVSLYIECAGYKSRVFDLDVTSNEELLAKLRTEIAKMKLAIHAGRADLFEKR